MSALSQSALMNVGPTGKSAACRMIACGSQGEELRAATPGRGAASRFFFCFSRCFCWPWLAGMRASCQGPRALATRACIRIWGTPANPRAPLDVPTRFDGEVRPPFRHPLCIAPAVLPRRKARAMMRAGMDLTAMMCGAYEVVGAHQRGG